jgi:predicted HicB family RNase H-like nuclease
MQPKTKKRLTLEIDKTLHAQAKCKAYQEGKTITNKITELIKEWLKIKEKNA